MTDNQWSEQMDDSTESRSWGTPSSAAEMQRQLLEALYSLSQLNVEDTRKIKEFALNAALKITRSESGYLFLMNEDETEFALHVWSGAALDACPPPETKFKVANSGLWGEAVRQRKVILTNDYQAPIPHEKGLPCDHSAGHNHLTLPVFDGDKIVLVVGVSSKPQSYEEEDARYLTLLMEGLWQALEKTRLLDALKTSEQKLRRFYEDSPLSYQSLGPEGRFIDVNPAWVATFGYRREDIVGREFTSIMTEESRALVPERFARLKSEGAINDVVFEVFHKEGHSLLISLNGRASYDDLGNFLYTNCFLNDVTESRRADSRLRAREEENRLLSRQFQTLLDNIPDRILLLDPDLRIVWTNQKIDREQQSPQKDPRGMRCYEVMCDKCIPCGDCPVVECFRTGKIVQDEHDAKDGTVWSRRAFPIRDDDGRVFNVVEICQDITDKIRLQKDTVRTGQLAALGELAAGVAHEINNPIGGVINYAQLLKNRSGKDSMSHNLSERIIREGDRVARIVRQLLFLARDSGEVQSAVNLTEVISDCLALVGSQFYSEGIDVSVTVAENLPPIYGNDQQLRQLFLNILSNTRYALNQRYPQSDPAKQLKVTLDEEKSASGSNLSVSFYDRGTGIPAELLGKVLQPFTTNKPASEGTGLGLSISHDIVKKHGGSLKIKSEEGNFTEVTISFPVCRENSGQSPEPLLADLKG